MTPCEYCGQEISDAENVYCTGCGKPLRPLPEEGVRRKSKALAVILALIFGPLGLLYLGVEGMMMVLCVLGLSFFLGPLLLAGNHNNGVGLLFGLLARGAAVWWALHVLDRPRDESQNGPDAEALLEEATRLENVDLARAIEKYKEIVAKHPNRPAAKAAKSCLDTMRASPA